MTPTDLDLSRRAVAAPHWKWRRGMVTTAGVVVWVDEGGLPYVSDPTRSPVVLPDLTDPGTLGHLLALVREAYGQPHAAVVRQIWNRGPRWALIECVDFDCDAEVILLLADATTEAEALVAALEAVVAGDSGQGGRPAPNRRAGTVSIPLEAFGVEPLTPEEVERVNARAEAGGYFTDSPSGRAAPAQADRPSHDPPTGPAVWMPPHGAEKG